MWHAYGVNNVEKLVSEWLPLPDVSELLGVSITKVHSLLESRALLAVRIGERKIRSVPAAFFVDGKILDSLRGTLVVLSDAAFSDEEAIAWLFTEDDSLPGRPVDALREGRKTEIRRRAQALGW
ncbi:Rv2175c family DNA-binding protein [Arthrobacter sp. A5]|uniref:Rv2175c family DNA-binding protein n=1 Tax=Arthrobacter sp. A5 TaxID=576926 RepID=UPI003DA846E7